MAQACTRPAYLPKLVVPAGAPCHACTHPRSSHSSLILLAACKVTGCTCDQYDPLCGCQHPLVCHQWGTAEAPWACRLCPCRQFGALLETVALLTLF